MEISAVLQDFRQRGFHLAAVPEGIEIIPASALTDADREAIRKHKAELLAVLAPQPGTCPACRSELDHQGGDCLYCAGCRTFFHANGRLMKPPAIPRPLTLEIYEAKQLLSDLQASGCEIKVTGSDVYIGNLTKLSDELLTKALGAGIEFRTVAREFCEAFEGEAASKWTN